MFLIKRVILPTLKCGANIRNISSSTPLSVHLSPILMGEPLKKKKRLDPAVVKQREERKRKRIEKQIRKLEKNSKQLKPIDECEIPQEIIDDPGRQRNFIVSEQVHNQRLQLMKEWTSYRRKMFLKDVQMIDRIQYSQQRALDELEIESEELYKEAIKPDETFLPFTCQGPVETPPIQNYDSPDGEYIDITKKWEN